MIVIFAFRKQMLLIDVPTPMQFSPLEKTKSFLFGLAEGDLDGIYTSRSVGVALTRVSLFYSTGCQVDIAIIKQTARQGRNL